MQLNVDLARLNSATKYPSIPTYHVMGERGRLTEEVGVEFHNRLVHVTEKIDGTNGRIVTIPAGLLGNETDVWLIGSREEFLTAEGDLVPNLDLGIVDTLRDLAGHIRSPEDGILVTFFEVYGNRKLSASKKYSQGMSGYRLFDAAWIDASVLTLERDRIASWRDLGGQDFYLTENLDTFAQRYGIPQVPYLGTFTGDAVPTSVADMHEWMKSLVTHTYAAIGGHQPGLAEGVVMRTQDRFKIAKARHEDYGRTLRH